MRRAACLVCACLLLAGCAKTEPQRVEVEVNGLGGDQLKRNGQALDAYDAWRKKWFEDPQPMEGVRPINLPHPFKGTRADAEKALAELDALASKWEGTAARQRAAVMRRLLAEAAKEPDGPAFRERAGWLYRDEVKESGL
jgi:hypothetical protein